MHWDTKLQPLWVTHRKNMGYLPQKTWDVVKLLQQSSKNHRDLCLPLWNAQKVHCFNHVLLSRMSSNLNKINIWLNEIQMTQQFYLFCYDVKELAAWGASDCALIFSQANSKRNSCSQQDNENQGWKEHPRLSWTTAAKSTCKQGVWEKWLHFHLVEGSVEMNIVQVKKIWDAQSKNMARTIKNSWYEDCCSEVLLTWTTKPLHEW